MDLISKKRDLLLRLLRKNMILKDSLNLNDLNKNSQNSCVIKAAITAGLNLNLIRIDRTNRVLITE